MHRPRRRRLIAWASRDETNAVDDEAKSSGRRQMGETELKAGYDR